MNLPQTGQIVSLRHRYFYIKDIHKYKKEHKLILESIDEDSLGDTIEVIWEQENDETKELYDTDTFPDVLNSNFDNPNTLLALEDAINWSASSFLFGSNIIAPLKGAIEIEDYQLEPVSRAVQMPRVNLLIADDVGLGKTVEAGLVVQEMLHRSRIKKILIVAPASLLLQWKSEMSEKFGLDFKIIDREELLRLRREYGINANPFTSYPRLIVSLDYVKKEQVKQLFKNSSTTKSGLKKWDMLILDEAHNTSPSGKQKYIKDSERTKLIRDIASEFEHRLFLTATPHNGYTESFTALLESLDPLRFSRGPKIDDRQLSSIMIRRLKENISSKKSFATRVIKSIELIQGNDEDVLNQMLDEYIKMRMQSNNNAHTVAFAMTILKKRALSSPRAFENSITWHEYATNEINETDKKDDKLLLRLEQLAKEEYSNDSEKDQNEEIATIETTKATKKLNQDEKSILTKIVELAKKPKQDSKLEKLIEFIRQKLLENSKFKNERLIIFTEYKDTMDYLVEELGKLYDTNTIKSLSGGATMSDREEIKHLFQESPSQNKTRILVATDAASEGLNLQNYCRYLIHYEVPWNPNKMEQRNGRIDRFGQKFDEVFICHFHHKNMQDSQFLEVLIQKTMQMRADIGAISEIIEKNVQNAILGLSHNLELDDKRSSIIHQDIRSELKTKLTYTHLLDNLNESKKKMNYSAGHLIVLLNEALKLHAKPPLMRSSEIEESYIVKEFPISWKNAKESLFDKDKNLKKIVFDPEVKKDREDVVLMHLAHPLIKYAISDFRKRLFPSLKESSLSRLSYKISSNLDDIYLEAKTRLLVLNDNGSLIHEEIVPQYFKMIDNKFFTIENFKSTDGLFSSITLELSQKLRNRIYFQKDFIKQSTSDKAKSKIDALKIELKAKATEHTKNTKSLIRDRIAEINERIKVMRGEIQKQINLFTSEEEIQYKDDLKWLEYRYEDLLKRLEEEPAEIKRDFTIKDTKEFFLSLTLYIPQRELN